MNRIKELRARDKISQQKLANELNVARSTIAMWETGGSQPDNNYLIALSEFFNVSIDYLLGQDEKKAAKNISAIESNQRTSEFMELFTQLTEEQQNLIISQIKGILANQ